MTARVLTGSKQEIAQKVANMDGEVREAIVFVEERPPAPPPADQTVQDIFAEMEPYMVNVPDVDYSREAIYTRKPGE
jgi:hypothetical protein